MAAKKKVAAVEAFTYSVSRGDETYSCETLEEAQAQVRELLHYVRFFGGGKFDITLEKVNVKKEIIREYSQLGDVIGFREGDDVTRLKTYSWETGRLVITKHEGGAA